MLSSIILAFFLKRSNPGSTMHRTATPCRGIGADRRQDPKARGKLPAGPRQRCPVVRKCRFRPSTVKSDCQVAIPLAHPRSDRHCLSSCERNRLQEIVPTPALSSRSRQSPDWMRLSSLVSILVDRDRVQRVKIIVIRIEKIRLAVIVVIAAIMEIHGQSIRGSAARTHRQAGLPGRTARMRPWDLGCLYRAGRLGKALLDPIARPLGPGTKAVRRSILALKLLALIYARTRPGVQAPQPARTTATCPGSIV